MLYTRKYKFVGLLNIIEFKTFKSKSISFEYLQLKVEVDYMKLLKTYY